jgi:1,4-alpha-glucan branching enzyme
LSHDEVVHGKGSLLEKMPGDDWRKFANLRLLYGYMYGMPGKKLLFMGGEFGQRNEWQHDASLEWYLLEQPAHSALQRWVSTLNRFYAGERALHEQDCSPDGFEWIDANDSDKSVVSFLRKAKTNRDQIVVVCNFTPLPRQNYRVGVPARRFLARDPQQRRGEHGGSGYGNLGGVEASPIGFHGRPYSLNLTVPPLGGVFLKSEG